MGGFMDQLMVTKRNGEVAYFDQGRIKTAIVKAFTATNKVAAEADIDLLVTHILREIQERFVEFFPNVENIQDIVEKPVQSVMVSAGICVIDPNLPAILPKQYLDMPDLLRQRIAANERVVAFPIHEYWIDVGRFSDLSRAAAEFDSHFTRADP